jgi:polysaccharide biosynthesis transport protein
LVQQKRRIGSMTIRDYLDVFSRRKWVILITFATVLAIAVVGTLLTTPKYMASAMMRVLAVTTGGASDLVVYDTKQLDRTMSTYAEFVTSRPMLNELVKKLGLKEWPQVEVEILTGTELMRITAEAADPVVARDVANALTEILVAKSQELYIGSGKTAQEILGEQLALAKADLDQAWLDYENLLAESPDDADRIATANRSIQAKEDTYSTLLDQYERNRVREALLANTLSIVEPAVVPKAPTTPRTLLNLALGVVVGLVGGIALAFLAESLDTTLYTVEQIKKITQLPVLGSVPSAGRQEPTGLFIGDSPQAEAFRRLRTSLSTLDRTSPLQTLLVTSSLPKEGKSTVAANLAFAVAQSGRKVILVDAHLRLPTLHRFFDLSNRVGLSSVLEGKATLDEAIQASKTAGVYVLTSGPLPPNPAELLSSPQMTQLIERLARQFALVLLDSPALRVVTDAAAVSQNVSGVVLVVELAGATQESVRSARQELADVKAPTIGVIVNRVREDDVYGYYQRMATSTTPVKQMASRLGGTDLHGIREGLARRFGSGRQGGTV